MNFKISSYGAFLVINFHLQFVNVVLYYNECLLVTGAKNNCHCKKSIRRRDKYASMMKINMYLSRQGVGEGVRENKR